MTADNNRQARLQKLSGSDYEIADGQPDIRKWTVNDDQGKKLGKVDELIFDNQSRKVRYLVLDLKGNAYNLDDKDVLIPIGIAQLHEEDDDVLLPGVTADQLRSLPEYDEDRLDTKHETSIRNVFGGIGGAVLAGGTALTGIGNSNRSDDFYDHQNFNEENLYRNRGGSADNKIEDANEGTTIPIIQEELRVGVREVETGGIRLRSRTVEQEVAQEINLREEHVKVNRSPVDRAAMAGDLREGSIEMREHKEVPVVAKEVRIVEEISLNKQVTERSETINDTVRSTEVDVEKR